MHPQFQTLILIPPVWILWAVCREGWGEERGEWGSTKPVPGLLTFHPTLKMFRLALALSYPLTSCFFFRVISFVYDLSQ